MIVDLRTYTLKPGAMGAFVKAYNNTAWAILNRYLPKCLGYYTVDIGVQNRVVHLWEYEDAGHRARCREALEADAGFQGYRAASAILMVAQETRIVKPTPFWPMKPAADVPIGIVDKRTYFLAPGAYIEWCRLYEAEGMAVQVGHLGRCIGFYATETGPQFQLVHLWAYADINDRQKRRAAMQADPAWNAYLAKASMYITHMENEILRPAPFWTPAA